MPLLLTPAEPLSTTALVPVPAVYAIILSVSYDTRQRLIYFKAGYYYSEQAYVEGRDEVRLDGLPVSFAQPATAEQANAVPIFTFLEQVLAAQLQALLGEGATIENVP